jgi:hypothetical protein
MVRCVFINILGTPFEQCLRTTGASQITANLVLESTIERIHHTSKPIFTDAYVGLFLIRGENVVLLGEVVRHCRGNVATPTLMNPNSRIMKRTIASLRIWIKKMKCQ